MFSKMIVSRVRVQTIFGKSVKGRVQVPAAGIYNRAKIGNRDWVAFGRSGSAYYDDDPSYPFPAVRFQENSNELLALREKEKGDWRKLTIEEKKILYRASFRQTLSEVMAPTGEWKSILGWSLFFVSLGIWSFMGVKMFVLPPRPITFEENWRRAQLRRTIDLRQGHLMGIASKWDYELDTWKK